MSDLPNKTAFPFGKLIKGYLALDFIWAALFATFVSSIFAGGLDLANCGVQEPPALSALGGISGWIIVFLFAMVQGGIFLVVGTVLIFVIVMVIDKLFRPSTDSILKWATWFVVADAIWAAVAATFFKSIIGLGAGLASNFAGCSAAISFGPVASVAGWLVMFIVAFIQGAIFAFVGMVVLMVFAVVLTLLFRDKDSTESKSDSDGVEK